MVQLGSRIWLTPTTYGSVFTHISQNQHLRRVYLDNEATTYLCSSDFRRIIDQVIEKGIPVKDFFKFQDNFCNEKKACMQIAEENKWSLFSFTPLQFSVQTVNYCNARCDFCYANAPNAKETKSMSISLIHKLKDYAAEHGVKFGVSGGEPLLHPHIFDILSYRHNEVFDTLITNLTPDINLDKLIETKVDLIQISIHGYDTIHDQIINIKDAYKMIQKKMNYLLPHVHLATNTVITPKNIRSISQVVEDLHRMQTHHQKPLTYIRFVPVVPSGTGLHKYGIKENFFTDVEHLLRKLEEKHSDMSFEIPMIHANPYEYKQVQNRWICPAGSTVAVIRLDGHIVPCNQFLDTTLVSKETLSDSSFESIWRKDALFSKLRKGIASTTKRTCNECMYLIMKEQDRVFQR
jgi:radical SAM protein with 4Fe4S-binding SPASM domain